METPATYQHGHTNCCEMDAKIARLEEEIRRLREERNLFPDWKKEAEYFRSECDRLHGALAAHRAVIRELARELVENNLPADVLAHPLVVATRAGEGRG